MRSARIVISAGSLYDAEAGREEAPDLVARGGDRRRDRQDVVDEERGPGDDPRLLAQELRRHEVSAAARPGSARSGSSRRSR